MPNYLRAAVPGASYFFTVTLADRRRSLLTDRIDLLRSSFRTELRRYPFRIDAMVVLPDHLHCIWTLPRGDSDFPNRWRRIKAGFSAAIPDTEPRSASRRRHGERGIWQRRYWEHLIRDERDLATHVDYIHYNPVKHGYVQRVRDWPHSSFQRYVRDGLLRLDWGDAGGPDLSAGE